MLRLKILRTDFRMFREVGNSVLRSMVKAVLMSMGMRTYLRPSSKLIYRGPDPWWRPWYSDLPTDN